MIIGEPILSPANKTFKALLKEKDAKGAFFLAEGYHLVEEAVRSGYAKEIYFASEPFREAPHIPQRELSPNLLKRLSSVIAPEGVIARCEKRKSLQKPGERIVYLDALQDPGNVGTILRTALAFGYKDIYLGPGTASPYNPKALLASQGALFWLSLRRGEGDATLSSLKGDGYAIYGTALRDSTPIDKLAGTASRHVLILGNEGAGVSASLLALSDLNLLIPIGSIDSLNVGVAGGILMYVLSKGGES